MSTSNHYIVYLYNIIKNDFSLPKKMNYYYNGMFRDGEILNNNSSLNDLIKSKIIIYIFMKN